MLENAKLGGYIPPACLDLNIFQLDEELEKANVALEKVQRDLCVLPKEYGKLCDAVNFYAGLHNIIWRELKYQEFFGDIDDENDHVMMYGNLNGFGGMGNGENQQYINLDNSGISTFSLSSANLPLIYPRLPETNLFKPFTGATSSVYNVDCGQSDTCTYTS
uniref:Uncharacterized protein n=1 Tax=Panagrolaimus superbus TaxID=310955 RepID=A0A914Y0Z3_9BILA